MSTCTNLDPRLVDALDWSGDHWELLVIIGLVLIIAALWRHGR